MDHILKNKGIKFMMFLATIFIIVACSVKKDRFLNRSLHSISAEYNILYNGYVALEEGKADLVATYKDDFWEILPVERLPKNEDSFLPGQTKNPSFERAEEKAVKAIQKHAMNIDGTERNPQMADAHLLLGKARYYDNRFIPALEAVNYILFKFPTSDKIYEAKVWREKIHIRMNNNETAIVNLSKLVTDKKISGQDVVDANAMLTQAFVNTKQNDSAIVYLKKAVEGATVKEEKARYRFILAQLYESVGKPDSAQIFYKNVIDMKRKSPRRYVIQAEAKKVLFFDYEKGDTLVFNEKYQKLLDNRENRPFLDVLYHYKGVYYERLNNPTLAEKNYKKSIKSYSEDNYLISSNYRNIGDIYFDKTNYKIAGKYYDSTLIRLNEKTREYKKIKKKRENLKEVIFYEDIATRNDSILRVVAMSPKQRNDFFQEYINKLKKQDSIAAVKEAEINKENDLKDLNNSITLNNPGNNFINPPSGAGPPSGLTPPGSDQNNSFYFYNPITVAYGKKEFQNKWGNRPYTENWRLSSDNNSVVATNSVVDSLDSTNTTVSAFDDSQPKYNVTFYTVQLPTKQEQLDSIASERNKAYYQLGVLYKEKFKEYELAANRLETLLKNSPEERLIMPAKYNLVKIYEQINPAKALELKNAFVLEFPDSRYAQILQNPTSVLDDSQNPNKVFERVYKLFQNNEIRFAKTEMDSLLPQYIGEEILPKLEALDAKISGRLEGVSVYKNKLNYVAVTYPNLDEGKEAQRILDSEIPQLEAFQFANNEKATWKILFPKEFIKDSIAENKLIKTLNTYLEKASRSDLKLSVDVYNPNTNFVVLHGFKSKESAMSLMSLLKDYKDYKIKDNYILVTSDNYVVIQIHKKLQEYIESNPKL